MKPVKLESITVYKLKYSDWCELPTKKVWEMTDKYRIIGGHDFTLMYGFMLLIPKEELKVGKET